MLRQIYLRDANCVIMEILLTLKVLMAAFITAMLCDSLWLMSTKKFYIAHLPTVVKTPFTLWPGFIVWLLIAISVVVFALPNAHSVPQAFLYGALLGCILYGVYDFTNMAVLKEWPLVVTLVDILWGTVLGSITTVVTFLIQNWN